MSETTSFAARLALRIVTRRLVLRRLVAGDAAALLAVLDANRAHLEPWIGAGPTSLDEAAAKTLGRPYPWPGQRYRWAARWYRSARWWAQWWERW